MQVGYYGGMRVHFSMSGFLYQELSWSGVCGSRLRSTGEAVQVWLEYGLW